MNKASLKIAWRSLWRDRKYTLLNLLGLATGLACTLLIYLWVADELHVDRFNKHDGRIFQVLQNTETPTGIVTSEPTPGLLAATLRRDIPEVEYVAAVIPPSWFDKNGILTEGGRQVPAAGQFVGEDYFKIFSYPVIRGDKNGIFPDKYSIALSEELAIKLFHTTENIVGRTVRWDQKDYSGSYRITGIFRQPPAHSAAAFDIVFDYRLFLDKNPKLQSWGNNDPDTYVMIKEGADATSFNSKIRGLIKSQYKDSRSTLFVQHFSDRYLYNHYENGVPAGGRIGYVRLFTIIAVFILLIACINFMNLSTARGERRIREIGVKMVLGANRGGIVLQYLGESLCLSVLSVLIALVIVVLLLPEFNGITEKNLRIHAGFSFVMTVLAITVMTGVLAGSYPALYLSGFKPALILRGKISRRIGELLVRRGLVVFQFTLSVAFIVSAVVIYRQMRLIETKNLGYNRDHLLYFEKGGILPDNKDTAAVKEYDSGLESLLLAVKNTPGVLNAACFRHNITNRNGGTYDISWQGKDPDTHIDFTDLAVGYDFIETAEIKMKEGRSFSRAFGQERSHIIFNEAAIAIMGLKDPVGKMIHLWGEDREIIGVTKNFNFQSLHENLKPCFFDFTEGPRASKIMVRIKTGREKETLERLSDLYRKHESGASIDYRFLDDDYQVLYTSEEKVALLSKYFASVTIVISCLGLFGLAAFTAQKRQKEIGIRKVVGASTGSVILLLSRDVLGLIGFALLIAFPLSAWLMTRWLQGFAYHVDLGIGIFLVSGISTVLIALLSISQQSLRAALANPVQALKSE